MDKKILVIQNHPDEGLGIFADEFKKFEISWDVVVAGLGEPLPKDASWLSQYHGLMVFGGPMSAKSGVRAFAPQICTVMSKLADASVRPSGANAAHDTRPRWPRSSAISMPPGTSQSDTVPRADVDASVAPSGENASDVTAVPCAFIVRAWVRVRASQTRITESRLAEAIHRPSRDVATAVTASSWRKSGDPNCTSAPCGSGAGRPTAIRARGGAQGAAWQEQSTRRSHARRMRSRT